MGNKITKSQVKKILVTDYKTIRNQIETGMISFMSGDGIISDGVQLATKSAWSHVGILFNLKEIDRVMLLESVVGVGVRFIPFSYYVYNHDCRTVVCRINNLPQNVDWNKHLALGIDRAPLKEYDTSEIARIVMKIINGEGKMHENDIDICSELTRRVFLPHYDFKPDKRGFISPENIWRDENVELLWRVK